MSGTPDLPPVKAPGPGDPRRPPIDPNAVRLVQLAMANVVRSLYRSYLSELCRAGILISIDPGDQGERRFKVNEDKIRPLTQDDLS